MKKVGLCVLFISLIMVLCGCEDNKKYAGYWCRYDETSIVTVMLNDNISDADKEKITEKLVEYGETSNLVYYSKADYAKLISGNPDDLDIYATYVASYATNNYIGTLVEELNKMSGVHEALQTSAKNNMLLYNLDEDGTYSLKDTDEDDGSVTKGKYKLKNGVITFTDDEKKTSLLYIKNDHLCVDSECNKIFARSDKNCKAVSNND